MKYTSTLKFGGVLALLCLFFNASAQLNQISLNSASGPANWKVRSVEDVNNDPAIHQVGYNTSAWVNASVPGTVFGSYVEQGLEADPNFGDNIYKVDKAIYNRDYWYRTEFNYNAGFNQGNVWLNFEGINRDADIYLNGNLLGSLHGFMERGKYNVSSLLNAGNNTLAVKVYLPVVPMNCSAMPSYVSSDSWDWMPSVPGLNMGITDDVYLTTTNGITINDPWIRTKVPSLNTGNLDVRTELENHTSQSITGTLTGTIQPGNHQFSQNVTIAAGQSTTVQNLLTISNPQLWWPNGYGDPNLYTCHFEFNAGGLRDQKDVTFGIKEYSYDTEGDILHLKVNGVRIFVKGGNWGMSEYMLRCRGNEYDTKLRLHKEMNFNMIRNWVGSTTDEEFYAACDKYGIMVWDDFWLITTYIYWPRSVPIFNNNVIEKVKRYRNHPSIAVWCGANEFDPSQEYIDLYTAAVSNYDGNDRRFQANSIGEALSSSGPWLNLNPASYYDSPPRIYGPESWGLKTELGTAVFPNYDSFKEFMPESNQWPRNSMWDQHFFGDTYSPAAGADSYFNSVQQRYGASDNIQDFCKKSQILNMRTNKAMFEGWLHNMWDDASGLLIWMSQSAYPSMVWQTYDYYHDQTGAYWGAKSACEPLHILMVPSSGDVEVSNTTAQNYNGLSARLEVINLDGQKVQNTVVNVGSVNSNTLSKISTLQFNNQQLTEVYFVRLTLSNGSGNVVSQNFYIRGKTENALSAINTLQPAVLNVTKTVSNSNGEVLMNVTVANQGQSIAFANRVQAIKGSSKERILPSIISDGYFTLLPGESKNLTIRFDSDLLEGESPDVKITPYNSSSSGSDNLALYKPVVTSSTVGDNAGSKAVDGGYGTRWESEYSDPQWMYVDLQDNYDINRIKITWEGAYASSYQVQVSDNATNWTTIQNVTSNANLVNEFSNLTTSARYVRIYGTARATIFGYSIYELEVYGSKGLQREDITDLGGTVSAQYTDSPAGEDINKLIDNSSSTKYLTFHNSGWVQFQSNERYTLSGYTITSANDNPPRDPASWTLQGSNDGNTWTQLDARSNETFNARFQNKVFNVSTSGGYAYYRLNITNNGAASLQLAELELFGTPYVGGNTNLALNKPTSSSSTFNNNQGSNAVDGSLNSRWESEYSDPQWLYVDLQNQYLIDRIKLTWEGAYASAFRVEVSNDANNWSIVRSESSNSSLENEYTGINATARYVRIYGTGRATIWGYSLFELEVYGSSTAMVPGRSEIAEESQDQSVIPYPNPFGEYLTLPVNVEQSASVQIKITSYAGQEVASKDYQISQGSNELILDDLVKPLTNGVYFIEVKTPEGKVTHRLIKNQSDK